MKHRALSEGRPDLLAQWTTSNLLSLSDVSCGSHNKVWWVCEKGYEWDAIVKNRVLLGSGCPYCSHRAVLKGYIDLQTEYPEIARSWSDKNPAPLMITRHIQIKWLSGNAKTDTSGNPGLLTEPEGMVAHIVLD